MAVHRAGGGTDSGRAARARIRKANAYGPSRRVTLSLTQAHVQRVWLFQRGHESIRIERAPAESALAVAGPGHIRAREAFANEIDLSAFLIQRGRELQDDGWILDRFGTERRRRNRRTRSTQRRRLDDRAPDSHE